MRASEIEGFHTWVFEHSPIAIVIMDPATHAFIDCNPSAIRICGYPSKQAFLGKTPADVSTPTQYDGSRSADKAHHYVRMALAEGAAVFEWRLQNPDGRIWDAEVHLLSFRVKDVQVLQFTLIDITERKRAAEALMESEKRLRQIIDLVPHFIFAKDVEGRFILVNEALAEAYGTTVEKLLGKSDADFARSEEEAAGFRSDDLAVIKSGVPKVIPEETITDIHGKVRVLSTVKIPFTYSGTSLPAVLGVAVDITERNRAEESLQKVQRLESLGILAGGIAHDFNNLLSGIYGNIDIAHSKNTQESIEKYLCNALGTLNRARGLTGQLLTFSKGGAPVKTAGSLVPFIQNAVQFALSGSSVSCRFNLQEKLWPCEFDGNQIGQVIDNIIINAKQAMERGGMIEIEARNVSLVVNQHATLPAGNYVRVSFRDQGEGIAREILPRIFDPFFTTKPKGHGLGLPTSYSIVTRHSGSLDVESEPGKGTTVHVILPAATPRVRVEMEPDDRPAKHGEYPVTAMDGRSVPPLTVGPEKHLGNGVFLIMDDEEVVRKAFETMLQAFGYTVVLTRSGEEAVEVFRAERAAGRSIVGMLFDLTIPGGLGGKEAIREIRALCSTTPVFVASGYAEDPVMANPQDYGFTASIRKPFVQSALIQILNRHMPTPASAS